DARRGGPGAPRPWRGLGGSPRARAREGSPERPATGRGAGRARQAKCPELGQGPSARRLVPGTVGNAGPRPPGRAGDAGPPGALERPTGAPVRSPTVTPTRQRRAAPAAHAPDRGGPTLAYLLATDLLREASRQTSTASAAGLAGVTAQPEAAQRDENLRA